jgi:hypothetical protein
MESPGSVSHSSTVNSLPGLTKPESGRRAAVTPEAGAGRGSRQASAMATTQASADRAPRGDTFARASFERATVT